MTEAICISRSQTSSNTVLYKGCVFYIPFIKYFEYILSLAHITGYIRITWNRYFFLWIEGFVHEVGLKIHYFYICWIFCRWLKRLNILVAKWIYKLLFLNVSLLWKSLDYLEFTVCAFALIPSKKLNKINNSLYLGFCDQKKHWNNEWITIKSPHLNGIKAHLS